MRPDLYSGKQSRKLRPKYYFTSSSDPFLCNRTSRSYRKKKRAHDITTSSGKKVDWFQITGPIAILGEILRRKGMYNDFYPRELDFAIHVLQEYNKVLKNYIVSLGLEPQ